MAITYNAGSNTITGVDYPEAAPFSFLDIYNADVAGGWGVFTRQCNNQYCSNAKLEIGDGSISTYFADTKKFIVFEGFGNTRHLRVLNNAHFRSGTLLNEGRKSTVAGCVLHFKETGFHAGIHGETGSEILLYSTHLSTDSTSSCCVSNVDKIYNTYFDKVYLRQSDVAMYNVAFMGGQYAMYACTGAWDKVVIRDYSASGITVSANHHLANVSQAGCGAIRAYHVTTDSSMTDCDIDTWHFTWSGCTADIYRKNSFDLKVVDLGGAISGANVKIWDFAGALKVNANTDVNGALATQTLNYGYYNNSDVPTMLTPHTIQISKLGYETYKYPFTVDKRIDWEIRLKHSNVCVDQEVMIP